MKNELIGKMLREYRKQNNLTVKKVAEKLTEHNHPVAGKTIYGWENGNTQPDADTLLLLCDLYNIENVLETFGYHTDDNVPVILNAKELELLSAYRNNLEMQDAVHRLLGIEEQNRLS